MKVVKKRLLLFFCTFLFSAFFIVFLVCNSFSKDKEIDKILKSSDYNYLPKTALNYIKNYYEENDIILLTEKNKKENLPYLNPDYVEYLVSDKNVDVIPNNLTIDYVGDGLDTESKFPSTFDLRNVNGKNFITPVKDQMSSGLCWAFAINGQAESHLLVKNNVEYSNKAEIFSERQVDYATSKNGFKDGAQSWFPYRNLYSDGGTFDYFMSVAVNHLAFVHDEVFPFVNNDLSKRDIGTIYNFSNSNYEVDSTVNFPRANLSEYDESIEDELKVRNSYLNKVKKAIMENGGAYISTGDPVGYCSANVNGYRLIYDDNNCNTAGHAMLIIGWDDDFSYDLCTNNINSNSFNYITTNVDTCDKKNIVKGKGAWLAKNSWGKGTQYVYIAYDSDINEISSISKMDKSKKWDTYRSNKSKKIENNAMVLDFEKSSNKEKLVKLKFLLTQQNSLYNVYVEKQKGTYTLIGNIESKMPGYYTLDLNDSDVILDNSDFNVKIENVSSNTTFVSKANIYTKNVDNDIFIDTKDATFKNRLSSDDFYLVGVSSKTTNIEEGASIDYKILDSNNDEINVDYSYSENTVYANSVYSIIKISKELKKGDFKLQTIYNGEVMDTSNINIKEDIVTIEGKGTKESPYLIKTPAQLDLVRLDDSSYYSLENDIDLTYDTQNENGLFYNEGKGWSPIDYGSYYGFSGVFNGNNHTIKGLYINRPEEDEVGLFKRTYNRTFSDLTINNLYFENVNITGKNFVGTLLGTANGCTYERKLYINNIYVKSGTVNGNNYVGGVIGKVRIGSYLKTNNKTRHIITKIFNSSTVNARNYVGGLFGLVTNIENYGSRSPIDLSYVQNIGNVISDNNASGLVGSFKMEEENIIEFSNAINTGEVYGKSCSNAISCDISNSSNGQLFYENIYYINNVGYNEDEKLSVNNVHKKSINELKDISQYETWLDFNNNFEINKVDDIDRIPIIIGTNLDYTEDIPDININIKQKVNIYDYIKPSTPLTQNIEYSVLDNNSVISINEKGDITPLKEGSSILHILSNYDGFEKSININVEDNTYYTVEFNSNTGVGTMDKQVLIVDEVSTLNKNIFKKDNYDFKCWNTKKDGSGISYFDKDEVLNLTNPKGKIILYAIWEAKEYKVIFNSNNGDNNTSYQMIKYDLDTKLNENIFTKKNYTFKDWNTNADGSGTSYEDLSLVRNLVNGGDEINLYAIWKPGSYEVRYDGNGGKGSIDSQLFTIDKETNLQSNSFTNDGLIFRCWNTKKDGSGISYLANEKVNNIANNGDIIVLYAIWSIDAFDIKDYILQGNVIKNIHSETTVSSYLSHFNLYEEYDAKLYDYKENMLSNSDLVPSASILKISHDGVVISEYYNVVKGDINGDSKITITDISKMFRHLDDNDYEIEESIFLLACDVNDDGKITITDVSKLFAYIVGNIFNL